MAVERIEDKSRPVLYLALIIIISYPLLYPIGLPIQISQSTVEFSDAIESLEEGDVVIYNYDVESYGWDELESMIMAINKHLYSKRVKIIYASTFPMGPVFIDKSLEVTKSWREDNDMVEGRDWVNIGYLYGEAAVATLATNFHLLISVDHYGNSVAGTFLDDVQDGSDIDLIISVDCYGGSGWFVNQFYLAYNNPILIGCIGVSIPGTLNRVAVGQAVAYLGGIPGGAEYELYTGYLGKGIRQLDAISLSHVMGLAGILVGNILMLNRKREGR